jgi:hypothetical protein
MVRILSGYSHPSSSFYLVNLMPLYLRDPLSLLHPPAPHAPPSDNPSEPLDTAYDPNKSNLPYQMVHTTSETNPESLLHVFLNIHSNTMATSSCHSVAMTFILDTPLLIRFHLQEPPPPFPVPSHHRFLSRFPDWRGTPQQFSYSIEVPLQPGVNHVVWCKHSSRGGMNTSFLPPCDGDWPTISPHPTAAELVIQFYSLQGDSAVNRPWYKRLSRSCFTSHPLTLCQHPPTVAVYSQSRAVPSLLRTALLAVVSQGHLVPGAQLGRSIPHRIVDETYHYLQVAAVDDTVTH